MFVHYATLHLPPEPDGFYQYNSLQHLAYFAVVFLLPLLSILTGLAMSPALDRFYHNADSPIMSAWVRWVATDPANRAWPSLRDAA